MKLIRWIKDYRPGNEGDALEALEFFEQVEHINERIEEVRQIVSAPVYVEQR